MAAIGAAWVDGAWIEAGWASGAWASAGAEISAATTGTAINVPEATIVSTGGTVIITLTNDTFIAAGTGPIGTTAQSQAFIDALSALSTPTNGWNNEVRDNLVPATHLARTSATVATFTIPATAAYDPGATEDIIPVVPAAILTTSTSDVTSSGFQITVTASGNVGLDNFSDEDDEPIVKAKSIDESTGARNSPWFPSVGEGFSDDFDVDL